MHRRAQSFDAGCASVGGEPVGENRPDAAVLPFVDDRERDLGVGAVANQACDPDRRVAGDRDEDVVVRIDERQRVEVGGAERGLGAPEPEQARAGSEPVEDRLDDLPLALPERPDGDAL